MYECVPDKLNAATLERLPNTLLNVTISKETMDFLCGSLEKVKEVIGKVGVTADEMGEVMEILTSRRDNDKV